MKKNLRGNLAAFSEELPARLQALPPVPRAEACARLGDAVWGAIRLQVHSRPLVWLGDFAWGMIKAHLLKKSNPNPEPESNRRESQRQLTDANPAWNTLVTWGGSFYFLC